MCIISKNGNSNEAKILLVPDANNANNNGGGGGGFNNLKGKVHFDITPKMVLKIERIKTELKSDYETQTAIDEYINNFRHDEPEIYVTLNQEHSHIIVRTADTKALISSLRRTPLCFASCYTVSLLSTASLR